MPATAHAHFTDDIGRVRAILAHAAGLPAGVVRDDLLRSSWMFAVGAMDAFFCDAYTDLIAATVSSKRRHPAMMLPRFVDKIRLPLGTLFLEDDYQKRKNWAWRMAARRHMERQNVLSLAVAKKLFNGFCRTGRKLFEEVLPDWIDRPDATTRLFGVTQPRFVALPKNERRRVVRAAHTTFQNRFRSIIQRRHDCIHNCDRPRVKPQQISPAAVERVINDVAFLGDRCDEHLNAEFAAFLARCGCPPPVIAQAGY